MATPSGPHRQVNGMLIIPASQTSSPPSRAPVTKSPTPRLKVIVRRLAPGLTETEFLSIIGEEWQVGQGKVDWFLYKPGKSSKDLSKTSRPSRSYFHLTSSDHVVALADHVHRSTFEDALNTYTSSTLIGPPVVEFAPYARIPTSKRRSDARAGTIDQDSEFMEFLEGLANPDSLKYTTGERGDPAGKPGPVRTTPLLEFLKEKKAAAAKDISPSTKNKRVDNTGKGKEILPSAQDQRVDNKKAKDDKTNKLVERAAKEAVRILNRGKAASRPPLTSAEADKLHVNRIPAAHARMLKNSLERDIQKNGLKDQASSEQPSVPVTANSPQVSPNTTTLTTPKATSLNNGRKSADDGARSENKASLNLPARTISAASATSTPVKSVVLLKKPEVQRAAETTATGPITANTTKTPIPLGPSRARKLHDPGAPSTNLSTRLAFIKHANPSQGVTESLLKAALENFGPVTRVEIDKRKGFAYVDFESSDALKAAMAANPIKVAQGTVQVMQRKGVETSIGSSGSAGGTPVSGAPAGPSSHLGKQMVRGGSPTLRGRGGGTLGRRGARGIGGRRGGLSSAASPPAESTGREAGNAAATS